MLLLLLSSSLLDCFDGDPNKVEVFDDDDVLSLSPVDDGAVEEVDVAGTVGDVEDADSSEIDDVVVVCASPVVGALSAFVALVPSSAGVVGAVADSTVVDVSAVTV